MLTLTNNGAKRLLSSLNDTDLTLRLYINDWTPTADDAVDDYIEAVGGGYKPISLNRGEWVIGNGDIPTASYNAQTFVFNGPLSRSVQVIGYYLTTDDGWVLWAERFNAPFTPANSGDKVKVTLRFQLRN